MFELRRFRKLAAVQWAENGRSYLWFLAIVIAMHLCLWLLVTTGGRRNERYSIDVQGVIYMGGYLVTGAVFALRYFSELSNRDSALTCLMRPASTFEKFLLALLVVAVLYPLAFTLAFQVCNVPGALLAAAARPPRLGTTGGAEIEYARYLSFRPYLPFADPKDVSTSAQVLAGNLFIQGLVIAGTLHFRRIAWLKTLVALFVLLVLLLPLLTIVAQASPSLLFWSNETRFSSPLVTTWLLLLWIGVPLLLWTGVFFLFRERELQ